MKKIGKIDYLFLNNDLQEYVIKSEPQSKKDYSSDEDDEDKNGLRNQDNFLVEASNFQYDTNGSDLVIFVLSNFYETIPLIVQLICDSNSVNCKAIRMDPVHVDIKYRKKYNKCIILYPRNISYYPEFFVPYISQYFLQKMTTTEVRKYSMGHISKKKMNYFRELYNMYVNRRIDQDFLELLIDDKLYGMIPNIYQTIFPNQNSYKGSQGNSMNFSRRRPIITSSLIPSRPTKKKSNFSIHPYFPNGLQNKEVEEDNIKELTVNDRKCNSDSDEDYKSFSEQASDDELEESNVSRINSKVNEKKLQSSTSPSNRSEANSDFSSRINSKVNGKKSVLSFYPTTYNSSETNSNFSSRDNSNVNGKKLILSFYRSAYNSSESDVKVDEKKMEYTLSSSFFNKLEENSKISEANIKVDEKKIVFFPPSSSNRSGSDTEIDKKKLQSSPDKSGLLYTNSVNSKLIFAKEPKIQSNIIIIDRHERNKNTLQANFPLLFNSSNISWKYFDIYLYRKMKTERISDSSCERKYIYKEIPVKPINQKYMYILMKEQICITKRPWVNIERRKYEFESLFKEMYKFHMQYRILFHAYTLFDIVYQTRNIELNDIRIYLIACLRISGRMIKPSKIFNHANESYISYLFGKAGLSHANYQMKKIIFIEKEILDIVDNKILFPTCEDFLYVYARRLINDDDSGILHMRNCYKLFVEKESLKVKSYSGYDHYEVMLFMMISNYDYVTKYSPLQISQIIINYISISDRIKDIFHDVPKIITPELTIYLRGCKKIHGDYFSQLKNLKQ